MALVVVTILGSLGLKYRLANDFTDLSPIVHAA